MWIEKVPDTFRDEKSNSLLSSFFQDLTLLEMHKNTKELVIDSLRALLNKQTPQRTPLLEELMEKKREKKLKILNLQEYEPQALAEQITIIDYQLFTSLPVIDVLNFHGIKSEQNQPSERISQITNRFETLVNWFSCLILQEITFEKRFKMLEFFIALLQTSFYLKNFNLCYIIINAFDSPAVARLYRCWEVFISFFFLFVKGINSKLLLQRVSAEHKQQVEEIKKQFSPTHNFAEYRKLLRRTSPPGIPVLGLYLRDLALIKDGNPDLICGLINFQKRTYIAKILIDIKRFQATPFEIQLDPSLAFHLYHLRYVRQTPDELLIRSEKIEPTIPETAIQSLLLNEKL